MSVVVRVWVGRIRSVHWVSRGDGGMQKTDIYGRSSVERTCVAIGEGGEDFSEYWDGDRGLPGGRMILCGYRLGVRKWSERRGRSGLPPWADIGRLNREGGEGN